MKAKAWRKILIMALLTISCGSTSKLLTFSSAKPDEGVRMKRLQLGRFKLDWDGMKPIESRSKEAVKQELLAEIQRDCPHYQLVSEGEDSEEDTTSTAVAGGSARLYQTYYWIRYRCEGG